MKRNKITSTDVAKAAGVSQATVSMILNKKSNVSFSKETIERVEKIAQEMSYETTLKKPRYSSKKLKVILVICPSLANPYYVMLIQGIEKKAKEKGYGVFICNTLRDLKTEENYLKMVTNSQVAGVIYTCYPSFTEWVHEISEQIPVVIIGDKRESLDIDAVELNSMKPGRLMAKHLIELGHKKVAFISMPLTERQPARTRRIGGFQDEFAKANLQGGVIIKSKPKKFDVVPQDTETEYKTGYDLTKELLDETTDVTAIVGMNDMIAVGIIDALMDLKYKIPKDISVMGCDNTLISKMKAISLTTVEHFISLKGKDACDIIFKKIDGFRKNVNIIEPTSIFNIEYYPKLIIRGTTSYPKIIK